MDNVITTRVKNGKLTMLYIFDILPIFAIYDIRYAILFSHIILTAFRNYEKLFLDNHVVRMCVLPTETKRKKRA